MSPATAFATATKPVSPRVLIVDDAQDDREMYALFLTAIGGCAVSEASSGREALHTLAQQQQPDVVVLDVMLPDIDGAEVCRLIRSSPGGEKTSVVTVTALPLQSAEIDRMITAGADAVLIKPCAPETLLAEIRALLHRSHALRQRAQSERERAAELRARADRLHRRHAETNRVARELVRHAEHLTLTQRARANYQDLPGLRLTVRQAMRLWGFDESICQRVLDALVSDGFLVRAGDGQYDRAE